CSARLRTKLSTAWSFTTLTRINREYFRREAKKWIRRVYGELLFRQATWHATLLHPFLYVIDSKCALKFGEAQLQAGGGVGVEVGTAGHVWQSHIYKDACGLTKQKVYQA